MSMRNSSSLHSIAFERFVAIRNPWNVRWFACSSLLLLLGLLAVARTVPPDGDNKYVLERENQTIVLEPCGPNIVRITLSTDKPAALATRRYGITGMPANSTWTRAQDSGRYDVIRSSRMVVRVGPENHWRSELSIDGTGCAGKCASSGRPVDHGMRSASNRPRITVPS